MLSGFNHLTLSVCDLPRSIRFYHQLLQFRLEAEWARGAYLSLPGFWLCLTLEPERDELSTGYTHYAFSIEKADFPSFCQRLRQAGVVEWKDNRSEGDSLYFLDPDAHQLEVHVGDLRSRLAGCRQAPYDDMTIYT
ncbi:VOC family protein [Musicola keenii]|uniref:VOC family protein n=1 Tax=Musicola keenii TaxID=2884250 RepID=UPI00177FEB16|nr:VOC family protein [Musicola keenii]